MKQYVLGENVTVAEALDRIEADVAKHGLDVLMPGHPGDLAEFRRFELAAALNRLRILEEIRHDHRY